MACNPCCCFSLKDSAIMIGIWTLVYSIASLFLFGWQTGVLNHCRTVTMSQANLQCEWDCPCVGSSNARTTRIIEGLFIIQILCLIAAFFLLFASVALIYGVHTWSRHLVWPWFICIISSILSSLAYCIMWWAGDVRDYWMALTILEIIAVFINVYCVFVVYMFMRRLTATTDEYEGKDPRVRYKVNRNGYIRKNLDDYSHDIRRTTPEKIMKNSYPHYTTPMRQSFPPYSPSTMPQIPLPMPPAKHTPISPYPVDDQERLSYEEEPKTRFAEKDDPVAHWVKDQQRIALLSGREEVNSEPVSPSREAHASVPLQHSRSVPSLYDGTLVSHRSCRHGKHRSSSRHRTRSRHKYNSTDTDSREEQHADRIRRSRSRTRYSESEISETTDRERAYREERHRGSRRSHSHNRSREKEVRHRRKWEGEHRRRRDDRDSEYSERRKRREAPESESDRFLISRRKRREEQRGREMPRMDKTEDSSFEVPGPGDGVFPLSGGISIPQHIVIPPSTGERGPDGQALPQKFQINSEITINYDGHNSSSTSNPQEPFRRRYSAAGVQSNV